MPLSKADVPDRITLRYFNCRGRGQALRYLLIDHGVEFADERQFDVRHGAPPDVHAFDDAQRLTVPDGSVIFDADGDLVARVSAGELLSLVGD